MFDTFHTFGQLLQRINKIGRSAAVHQVVGRLHKGLVADVQYEERGQSGRQRIHDSQSEKCSRNSDQCRNRGNGILAMILGNRQQRRAFKLLAGFAGDAVQPFLDDDRNKSGHDSDPAWRPEYSGHNGDNGFKQDPATGNKDHQ